MRGEEPGDPDHRREAEERDAARRQVVHEEDGRAGRRIGLLYGLNTLGAAAGVLLTSYVLFPLLGLRGASHFGAGLVLAVGAMALAFIAPRVADAPAVSPPTRDSSETRLVFLPPFTVTRQ